MIKENLDVVKANIKKSILKSNRNEQDVHLIAMSKTKPVKLLMEAYDNGIRDFGENKVQELTVKYEEMPKDIRWHMIGHLQTNKVKYIADKVYMIHSVDSVKLAQEISKQAQKVNRIIPILLEINIAAEETKFGLKPEDCIEFIESIHHLPGISIKGLMAVPPNVEFPEKNRVYFNRLKQLSVDITQKNIDNVCMDILSMGMSGDYEVAIEEGATYIRVGTGIFGERDYLASTNK